MHLAPEPMYLAPLLLVATGAFAFVVLATLALAGSPAARNGARRLHAVRLRHADQAVDRVEAQLRRAVAARAPLAMHAGEARLLREALRLRLHRTGRAWTTRQYVRLSLGLGGTIAALALIELRAMLPALALGLVVGAGVPHLLLDRMIARRGAAFIARFPDAIDLLVRGLRSGLPVGETFTLVATEIPAPVGEEFRLVTERVRIGKPMDEALQETADRLATTDFNFFCIALSIQRETGGNLAETLSNLAQVLRQRAQMGLKVRALSSEAKASAMIVGALPFIVFALLMWINPDYVGGFFHERRLILAGCAGLVWMGIGVAIMVKMVRFKF